MNAKKSIQQLENKFLQFLVVILLSIFVFAGVNASAVNESDNDDYNGDSKSTQRSYQRQCQNGVCKTKITYTDENGNTQTSSTDSSFSQNSLSSINQISSSIKSQFSEKINSAKDESKKIVDEAVKAVDKVVISEKLPEKAELSMKVFLDGFKLSLLNLKSDLSGFFSNLNLE